MNAEITLLRSLLPNGILQLTLNDPSRRNVLSDAMLDALTTAISDAGEHHATRVVIIAANGPVFCAGHDLKEMTEARDKDDRGQILTPASGY